MTFDTNISALSKWRDLVHRVQRYEKLFQNDKSSLQMQQLWRAAQIASIVAITQKVIESVRLELTEKISLLFQSKNLLTYPDVERRVHAGELFIRSWYYHLETGELEYFNTESGEFEPMIGSEN